jgi:oligoribonuclease
MDLEMTGLDPERDVIIEMATLITDANLNLVAEGPTIVIHRDPALFDTMDDWNKKQHGGSGLWQKVVDSTISEREAEAQTLAFLKAHVGERQSPLCGNSVWQDRRFLARYMRSIDAYLHYRLVDVSTLKELTQRWYPKGPRPPEKPDAHRALDDIKESVEELKFYRDHYLVRGI